MPTFNEPITWRNKRGIVYVQGADGEVRTYSEDEYNRQFGAGVVKTKSEGPAPYDPSIPGMKPAAPIVKPPKESQPERDQLYTLEGYEGYLTKEELDREIAYREKMLPKGQAHIDAWVAEQEATAAESQWFRDTLSGIYGEQDLGEVVDFINREPKIFQQQMKEQGRTPEIDRLLKEVLVSDEGGQLTDEDLNRFWGVMEQSAPIEDVHEEVQPDSTITYVPESKLKDTWDAFYLGLNKLAHSTKQMFTSTLPDVMFDDANISPNLSPEEQAEFRARNQRMRDKFRAIYAKGEAQNEEWIASRRELQPKPEYQQNFWDKPELLKDPGYWGVTIANALPFTLGVMGVTVGTTLATKSPMAGMAAGLAFASPSQIQDLRDDLIASGVPEAQASSVALPVGTLIAAVEVASDLPFLSAVFKPFRALTGKLQKEVIRLTALELLKRGTKNFTMIEVSEVLEEIAQGVIQNTTVGFFDENRGAFDGIVEQIPQVLIATSPFALFGGAMSLQHVSSDTASQTDNYQKMRDGWERDSVTGEWYKPEKMADTYERLTAEFENAGMPTNEARIKALNQIARTAEGESVLSRVAEQIKQKAKEIAESERGSIGKVPEEGAQEAAKPLEGQAKIPEAETPVPEVKPSVEPIKGQKEALSEEQGKAIAKEIGVKFDGIQEGIEDVPATFQLTDPQTGTTINATSLEDARSKVEKSRTEFEESGTSLASVTLNAQLLSKGYSQSQIDRMTELEKMDFAGVKSPIKPPSKTTEGTTPTPKPQTNIEKLKQSQSEITADISIAKKHIADAGNSWDVQFSRLALSDAKKLMSQSQTLIERIQNKEAVSEDEIAALNDRIQSIKDFYKHKLNSQEDIKQALTDYINENLPLTERGKLVALVKNTSNDKELQEAFNRIDEISEKSEQKRLRTKIEDTLSKYKVKKKEGILQGKLTADVQEKLDWIKTHLKDNRAEVLNRIDQNIEAIDVGKGNVDQLLDEIELLQTSGIDGMSADELKGALDTINQIIVKGRTDRQAKREANKERRNKIKTDAINVITGGKGLKPGTGILSTKELESNKSWFDKLTNWQYGWPELLDKLSKFHKSEPYKSPLSEFGRIVQKAQNAESAFSEMQFEKVLNIAKEAYGVKDVSSLNRILNDNQHKEINLGTVKANDGTVIKDWKLTKNQMMAKYIQNQDPTLAETFHDGMKWSTEMLTAIANNLTEQDAKFADSVMTFYSDYYKSINEVFREKYGVDLPYNSFYSPLNRDVESDTLAEHILTFRDGSRFASYQSGHLKSRVGSIATLKMDDMVQTLASHIHQMEHFKAWANTLTDLRSVFGNSEIRNAITQYHGKDALNIIDGFINDMARGSIERAKVSNWTDRLRVNLTRAMLAIKPAIALKQIPSIVTYATEMRIDDFIAGVADYWTNPLAHHDFMMKNSQFYSNRFKTGAMERDIALAMKKGGYKQITKTGNFLDIFMTLIRFGDKLAVSQGMWAKYKAELKRGNTPAEAIRLAEETTQRTQPTSDIASLSALQRGGSFMKLFTMFQNQPNKYFRIIATNARNFQYGRGNRASAVKNITIAWVIAPVLWGIIDAAGRWERERWLTDVLAAPVNFLLIAGNLAKSIEGWLTDEPFEYQASPVFQSVDELQKAFFKGKKIYEQYQNPYKDIDAEDVIGFFEYMAKFTGYMTGLPAPYLVQAEQAIRRGEPKELVFSKYSLKEPEPSDVEKAEAESDKLGQEVEPSEATVEKREKVQKAVGELPLPKPKITDMHKLDVKYKEIFKDKLPSDVLSMKDATNDMKSWAEKELVRLKTDILPDVPLYRIVDDGIFTVDQYIQQWKARQAIDSLELLREFDSATMYPDAKLGNLTRRQIDILKKYESADNKKQFLKDNADALKFNPMIDYLKNNPNDDALLSVWGHLGKKGILTKDAWKTAQIIIRTLDIPNDAVSDYIPSEEVIDNVLKYQEALKDHTPQSWEVQLMLAQDIALREYLGRQAPESNIKVLELQVANSDNLRAYEDAKELPSITNEKNPKYTQGSEYVREVLLRSPAKGMTGTLADVNRAIDTWKLLPDEFIGTPEGQAMVDKTIERGKLVDKFGANSPEVKEWLIDNEDWWRTAVSNGLLGNKETTIEDIEAIKAREPIIRIDVQYAKDDESYDNLPDDQKIRRAWLSEPKQADYWTARIQRDAYQAGIPDEVIPAFVEYNKMPLSGYERLYARVNNPDLNAVLMDEKYMGEGNALLPIDLAKLPSEAIISLQEQWGEQLKAWETDIPDKYSSIIDSDKRAKAIASDREALFNANEGFKRAKLLYDAYKAGFKGATAENVASYYELPEAGYDRERFLKANPKLYAEMKKTLGWTENIDFDKIPSEEVERKFAEYNGLTKAGYVRENMLLEEPDLAYWMLLTGKIKRLPERDKIPSNIAYNQYIEWQKLSGAAADIYLKEHKPLRDWMGQKGINRQLESENLEKSIMDTLRKIQGKAPAGVK